MSMPCIKWLATSTSGTAIEIFNVTSGKQTLAKKPGDFQTVAGFSDFASELETCGSRRTHAQTCGKIRQRNLRHGMVLQSKANLEKWIISRFRLLAERARQLDERDGIGKRVNRLLMSRS